MAETRAELGQHLARLREEEEGVRGSIDHVYELLSKADQRRRDRRGDRRRWNRTVDNLERTLLERKSRLVGCEQEIIRFTRKLDETEDASEAPPEEADSEETLSDKPEEAIEAEAESAVEASPSNAQELTSDEFELAAEYMLTIPLKEVGDISLQEVGLVKTFLESEASSGLSAKKRKALGRRIERYDREKERKEAAKADSDRKERRQQILLRSALDRCASDQIGSLTLNEIELIANCFEIVSSHSKKADEDAHLKAILEKAVRQINEKCARLNRLHRQLHRVTHS